MSFLVRGLCLGVMLFAVNILFGSDAARADSYVWTLGHTQCYDMTTYMNVANSFCSGSASSEETAGKTQASVDAANSAANQLATEGVKSSGSATKSATEYVCYQKTQSSQTSTICTPDNGQGIQGAGADTDCSEDDSVTCSGNYKTTTAEGGSTSLLTTEQMTNSVTEEDMKNSINNISAESSQGSFDISPALKRLSIQAVGLGGSYSRTSFSTGTFGQGGSRISQTGGINVSYAEAFDDWGYSVLMPVTRTINNGSYSSFDQTGVGLAAAVYYKLLKEQVHGLGLDVGFVVGQQYSAYDHESSQTILKSDGFENPYSVQTGIFLRARKQITSLTTLKLQLSELDSRNLVDQSAFGRDVGVTTGSVGVARPIWFDFQADLNLKTTHIEDYSFGTDRSYEGVSLSLSRPISRWTNFNLSLDQSFGNSTWSTTSGTMNLVWKLN